MFLRILDIIFPTGPSTYPPNFRFTTAPENGISLAWDKVPCVYENGPILGYQLTAYYFEGMFYLPYWTDWLDGKNTTTIDYRELSRDWINTPGLNIGFTIAAYNQAGGGNRSPILETSTST